MIARRHSILLSAATLALSLSIAAPASAQSTGPDGRWQAWLGCWTPSGTLIRVIGKTTTSVVCVIPTTSVSAVEVVTVTGGKIVDRTRVDTDGQPHALSKEGCTGWQSAKWSPSATRVYLKSEFNCSGAPLTHLSAVYAMAGSGEWIDVQGMRVEKNSGVHAVRYRQATDVGELPAEITQKLQQRSLAKKAALLAVSEQPSLLDVEEASHELDASVVATWLIEADKLSGQRPTQLNSKQLVQLADNGVPGSVIDVMLGLSYPNVLSVNPVNYGVARQSSDSAYAQYGSGFAGSAMNPLIGFDRFGNPIYASESARMYGCSPYLSGSYDAAWNLYASQFGCSRYNSGFGYGGEFGYGYGYGGYPYYGGNYGGGPVVVPVGTGGSAAPHGRMVNGKGYTQGSDGSASPRANNSQPSGSGSSAGSGSAPPPPSSPPPPPPQRTAEPKKP